MILTYRRPGPPDTHAMTMVNNVIEVLNNVIAACPLPLNSVIADIRSSRGLPRLLPVPLSLLFNLCCPGWHVLPLLSGVSP